MIRIDLLRPQILLLGCALLLGACGGASDEPRQVTPAAPTTADSMSGTVSTGVVDSWDAPVIKPAAGRARRASIDLASGQYLMTLQLSEPPYMLEAGTDEDSSLMGSVYAVSTRGSNVNVTPLTSLVAAFALRQRPEEYFFLLGGASSPDLRDLTDADIARGERRARELLARWDVAVPGGIESLVYDPYTAVPGDPMYELLADFRAAFIARGETFLRTLLRRIGDQQALCATERVVLAVPGREDDFCTNARSTSRSGGLDVYGFSGPDIDGFTDTLTVRAAADGSIDSAELVDRSEGGTATYACSGAGCAGITAGTPDADGRHPLNFANAALPHTSGSSAAVLNGSLLADALGSPSPQALSCTGGGGFFHVLLSASNTFPGACVEEAFVNGSGPANRATYLFGSSFGTTERVIVDGEELFPRVHADGSNVISVILYSRVGEFDATLKAEFKCGGVGYPPCNGVTVVPGVGFPGNGSISLNDTVLYRVDANGARVSNDTATVRASSLVTGLRSETSQDEGNCDIFGPQEDVTLQVDDGLGARFCPDESNYEKGWYFSAAGFRYEAYNGFGTGAFYVYASEPGSTVPLRVEADRNDGELFYCDQPACLAGVTISEPDADGRVRITFDNVALPERDLFNTAGDRAGVLDGTMSFVDGNSI